MGPHEPLEVPPLVVALLSRFEAPVAKLAEFSPDDGGEWPSPVATPSGPIHSAEEAGAGRTGADPGDSAS